MNKLHVTHLLEDGSIDIETEISNIQSGGQLNISIRQILLNHEYYENLSKQIEDSITGIGGLTNDELAIIQSAKHSYEINALKVVKSIANLKKLNVNIDLLSRYFMEGKMDVLNSMIKVEDLLFSQSNLLSLSKLINDERNR